MANTSKQPKTETRKEKPVPQAAIQDFRISMPALWLAVCVLVLYISCFSFGLTDLDDTIFINDFRAYNEDITNLFTSFTRGVFDATNDIYYRPLFMDSMVLNNLLSGDKVEGYHVMNVIFHLINVLLVYKLFKRIGIKQWIAFGLAMIFAVHPVLTQAVAWIPGRNDTLLAMFTLSYLIFTIDYTKEGKPKHLLLASLFLLCAYFTKETAVFISPVAFLIITLFLDKKWLDKRSLIQYAMWAACFLIWYFARSAAHLKASYLDPTIIVSEFPGKLPIILQYLGKIFLPFNLSVFPIQEDTVYYYGIAAVLLLAVLIFLAKGRNNKKLAGGILVFLLFLLPLLILPRALNEQTFEHRLYLPLIGILMVLPETIIFGNGLKEKQLFTGVIVVAAIFAGINYRHQQNFTDPLTFWEQAEETSPHSAYAVMMRGARTKDKQVAYGYIRRAYKLNPKEKYLNYYYGVMLHENDSAAQSEKYFLEEKKISDYFECDFYLSDISYRRKDYNTAIAYLNAYLKRNPANPMGNNNLLLLYLTTKQKEKATEHAKKMQELGLPTPKLPG